MPDATLQLFTHGNLITLDAHHPRATAMVIRGNRIAYVGNDAGAQQVAGAQTIPVDLDGKTVVPGFCDSHIHLYWYGGQILTQADLVGSASVGDIQDRLLQLAGRSTSGWIQGHGFDQDKLKEKRFPTRLDLDAVSRDRPIIVSRICGHATVVNSAALALVSPEERSAGDEQTGLYTENDSRPFYALIPELSEAQAEEAVLAAANVALKTGITSVHTLLDTPDQMAAYARLRRKGKLPIRVVGLPQYDTVATLHAHGINTGFGDDWLRFGAAKFFSDGSMGAQTALLAKPYADKPDTCGIRIYDPEDLKQKCRDAQKKGFQLAIHAIGDQAVRESIDAIEYALDGQPNETHRHRIEHASMVDPECMERIARLKIVCTLQPQFVTSDTWTADRIGPSRVPWAYPFRSLLRNGVPITLSSDCPVEKLDAFACIASAVGRHAWSPEETLTPEEAIRAYCLGSAYAAHMDNRLGSLEAGKLADFVILSDDPSELDAGAIAKLSVDDVYIDGRRIDR